MQCNLTYHKALKVVHPQPPRISTTGKVVPVALNTCLESTIKSSIRNGIMETPMKKRSRHWPNEKKRWDTMPWPQHVWSDIEKSVHPPWGDQQTDKKDHDDRSPIIVRLAARNPTPIQWCMFLLYHNGKVVWEVIYSWYHFKKDNGFALWSTHHYCRATGAFGLLPDIVLILPLHHHHSSFGMALLPSKWPANTGMA